MTRDQINALCGRATPLDLTAPVLYFPTFVENPNTAFMELLTLLEWNRRNDPPRNAYYEHYCSDVATPYEHDYGEGLRMHYPRPYPPLLQMQRRTVEDLTGVVFETCFVNRYSGPNDHLDWHTDLSPETDNTRPIATISLGAKREILFCRPGDRVAVERLSLAHGSLLLMLPGMQDGWLHCLPKANTPCGERVSLNFRGHLPISSERSAP